MALGTTTKGTKSRLANMTPAQLNFLETFILSGKSVSDLTGKNVKKIDKAEKQKIKDYEIYAKKAKELNEEIRDAFIAADGKEFTYIPCLNDDDAHIAALAEVIDENLAGWV